MKTTTMVILAIMALTCVANAQSYNEFGPDAGNGTMTGSFNTANGFTALFSDTTGSNNVAHGYEALYSNMDGSDNTANGFEALFSNTTGSFNTANGDYTLYFNTTGNENVANGDAALLSNTTGGGNTANGQIALFRNTTGVANTADGVGALQNNTTGNFNIALGAAAGENLTTGYANIEIGNRGFREENRTIRIGTIGDQSATYIAGISGVTVPNAAKPVVVDSVSGQLGTVDISSLKGVGFVPGAYLYLPATATAPDGFTKIGTKTDLITDLHGHMKTLKMNVYQKN